MKPERWQRVEQVYNAALERKPDQREAFLEEACAGDDSLRKEVESLLACQSEAKGFIESPALEAAAQDLARDQSKQASLALAGRTLSHYRIIEKLGEGGMGIVYKAFDTRLNRAVALKVLPPDKVSDPERKRRFVKEARAASALNHPNIVTIHDIDQADGVDFIAMEYVAGKTLDRQIPCKGMQIAKALEFAMQLANALAAAHSAGIIHRDLKPSNVMVSDSGQVKILDFGLAKLIERAELNAEGSPPAVSQETSLRTDEGMILGTAAYMSPEQAQGKKVDSRSDIFSFGAVLYEMVSGRKAFEGDGMASTLAAIIRDEPEPLGEIAVGVPAELERIIRRCLRKDPDRRWQAMPDLRVALRELSEESDSHPVGAATPPFKRYRRRLLIALLALPLLAAAGWLTLQYAGRKSPPPALAQLTSYPGSERFPCFSPDGRQVAFTWNGEKEDNEDIYVKLVGETNALRLTTDPAPDRWPAWSQDAKRIAFKRLRSGASGIWWVSPLGGAEQKLADVQTMGQMSWSPDGKWLAVARGITQSEVGDVRGIFLVPGDGGEPLRMSNPKAPGFDTSPGFSADGRLLAYASCTNIWSCDVFVQQLDSGYAPRGVPRPITHQGLYISGLAWSRDGGSLLYSGSRSWGVTFRLWRVGSNGGQEPERLDLAGFRAMDPYVAPAGDRLAFSHITSNLDVWRYQLGGVPEPFLTSSLAYNYLPQYSPDGSRIAFSSDRSGDVIEIWTAAADGSQPVQLTKGPGRGQGTPRWSPDGRLVAFDSLGQDGISHIYVIDANGGRPRRVSSGTSSDFMPSWSHDGRWIYFYSNRSGRNEVWRVPFGEGAAQQITDNGGEVAFESMDGKTLFYTKSANESPLFARSPNGGPERQVVDFVRSSCFAVLEDGIYYYGRPGSDNQHPIKFYEFSTKTNRLITQLGSPPCTWA
jgi:serine/threonine protein kinase/Tol biopolymer transport system component